MSVLPHQHLQAGVESKLSKVTQLSGFSDPVYVEAYVNVHQYDIVLDGEAVIMCVHSHIQCLL